MLSPSIFKCVLALWLRPLKTSVFYGNIGLSSVAYADDVLLVARTRRGLLSNFTMLTNKLSKIGLSLNASKCEFICFNSPYAVAPFVAGTAVLSCSSLVSWLCLCFGPILYHYLFIPSESRREKPTRHLRENILNAKVITTASVICIINSPYVVAPLTSFVSGHGSSVP